MPIRVLFLEDSPADFELISEHLRAEGLQLQTALARSGKEFELLFNSQEFDLILSDYTVPGYSGFAALRFTRAVNTDLPFILISGTLSEEQAVEGLKAGATDYIIKERLHRLGPAIRRALDQAGEKKARLLAEKQVEEVEAQLLRAQRIQTLGALSGGIAHDLNNALAPIIMAAEILTEDVQSEPGRRMLNLVRTSAKRCADMVKQILSFSRGAGQGHEPLNAAKILEELADLARETFPRVIRIHARADSENLAFLGNITQIQQVVMNLLVNARDAISGTGAITISARKVQLRNHSNQMLSGPANGPFISISVADTGSGIPPAIVGRIFEPFFTTKEPGKGTGLGLSTVFSIVKAHSGFIQVRTDLAHGTTFEIFFPALAEETETRAQPAPLPVSSGERLLVVDDEVGLLALLKSTLETLGYEVATASGGLEAVALIESSELKFDLVLTDWVMPLLGGSELLRRMRAASQEMRIIVVTGSLVEASTVRESGANGILQKPYSTETLLATIHAVLEGEEFFCAEAVEPQIA